MEKKSKTTKKITNSEIQNDTQITSRFLQLRQDYNEKHQTSYTQKEFSTILGLSAGKVSELESGKKSPSVAEALAYNKVTGASLEYLFEVTTQTTKQLGLTNKSINNLRQLKSCSDDTDNAFLALNHLLSSPDALHFLNILFHLWSSPGYNIFNTLLADKPPSEIAQELLASDSTSLSYALKCNMERQLLNYIDNHGFYKEKEYKKITASDNSDTAIFDFTNDLSNS